MAGETRDLHDWEKDEEDYATPHWLRLPRETLVVRSVRNQSPMRINRDIQTYIREWFLKDRSIGSGSSAPTPPKEMYRRSRNSSLIQMMNDLPSHIEEAFKVFFGSWKVLERTTPGFEDAPLERVGSNAEKILNATTPDVPREWHYQFVPLIKPLKAAPIVQEENNSSGLDDDEQRKRRSDLVERKRNGSLITGRKLQQQQQQQQQTPITNNDPSTDSTADKDIKVARFSTRVIPEDELNNVKPLPSEDTITSPGRIDSATKKALQLRLMSVYNPKFKWNGGAEVQRCERRVSECSPYPETPLHTILITFEALEFENPPMEPFFCRAALYDVRNYKKISADFHFHLNAEKELAGFPKDVRKELIECGRSKHNTGIFYVSEPNPNIHLVVTVERVLHSRGEDVYSHYSRKLDERQRNKYRTLVQEQCSRLSVFRQPFLFGHKALFVTNDQTVELVQGIVAIREMFPLQLSGSSPFDFIEYIQYPERFKLGKPITTKMQMRITTASLDELEFIMLNLGEESKHKMEERKKVLASVRPKPNSHYSQFLSYNPCEDQFSLEEVLLDIFRVTEQFPLSIPRSLHLHYNNILFIMPEFLNFIQPGPLLGNKSARNIAIKIIFRTSDDASFSSLSRVVHPYDGDLTLRTLYTSVSYHQKFPQWMDEIKVDLPIPLTEKHHILFMFFHVKTHGGAKGKKGVAALINIPQEAEVAEGGESGNKSPVPASGVAFSAVRESTISRIGFSVLPLNYRQGYVPDGTHRLPVYQHLVDGYLNLETSMVLEKYSGGRPIFSVRTTTQSTVYPQEPVVTELFHKSSLLFRPRFRFGKLDQSSFVASSSQSASTTVPPLSLPSGHAQPGEDLHHQLQSVVKTLESIKRSNFGVIVPHIPVVLNTIFRLMCEVSLLLPRAETDEHSGFAASRSPPGYVSGSSYIIDLQKIAFTRKFTEKLEVIKDIKTTQLSCFTALLHVTKGVSYLFDDNSRSNRILSAYLQFIFDNPAGTVMGNGSQTGGIRPVYEMILEQWNIFLAEKHNSSREGETEPSAQLSPQMSQQFSPPAHSVLHTPSAGSQSSSSLKRRSRSFAVGIGMMEHVNANIAAATARNMAPITDEETVEYSWFLFDLMAKSITLVAKPLEGESRRAGAPPSAPSFSDPHFMSEFKFLLSLLVPLIVSMFKRPVLAFDAHPRGDSETASQSLVSETGDSYSVSSSAGNSTQVIARRANNQLALFICDLILLQPIHYTHEIVDTYLELMQQYSASTEERIPALRLQLDFFEVLMDFEHIMSVIGTQARYASLADLFLFTIIEGINSGEQNITRRALDIFRTHLTKLDHDARYQERYKREHIAALYFPFVRIIMENEEIINRLNNEHDDDTALSDCIACILSILSNLNPEKTRQWLRSQGFRHLSGLIEMLTLTAVVFRHHTEGGLAKKTIVGVVISLFSMIIDDLSKSKIPEMLSQKAKQAAKGKTKSNASPSKPEEVSQTMTPAQCIAIFERAAHLLMNLLLSSTEHDHDTCRTIFAEVLPFFIDVYMTTVMQLHKDGQHVATDSELDPGLAFLCSHKTWRWLVGSILLHCEFPSRTNSHPDVRRCLRSLIDPFVIAQPPEQQQPMPHQETDEEIILTEEGEIIGATLAKLVEKLCVESGLTSNTVNFQKTFFLTYRSFTTSKMLLRVIIERYRWIFSQEASTNGKFIAGSQSIRLSNAVKVWIKSNFEDFDNEFLALFIHFLDDELSAVDHVMQKLSAQNKKDLQKQMLAVPLTKSLFSPGDSPEPCLPPNFSPSMAWNLLEWPAIEVARQMSLIEWEMFNAIHPSECFKLAWTHKAKRHILAPHIVRIAEHFNMISTWVRTLIVRTSDLRARKALLVRFLEICEHLYSLCNFCSLQQIVSALNSAPVSRLRKTWELLVKEDPKLNASFQNFVNLLRHPFTNLRRELGSVSGPCVPFLGQFLTDLFFVEEHPDYIIGYSNQLINFRKITLYGDVVTKLQEFQQRPYILKSLPYLAHVLQHDLFGPEGQWDDDKLFEQSLLIEPRSQRNVSGK